MRILVVFASAALLSMSAIASACEVDVNSFFKNPHCKVVGIPKPVPTPIGFQRLVPLGYGHDKGNKPSSHVETNVTHELERNVEQVNTYGPSYTLPGGYTVHPVTDTQFHVTYTDKVTVTHKVVDGPADNGREGTRSPGDHQR